MHRRILAICTALAALGAFATVPAMAAASPVLTENGSAVATGKKIIAIGESGTPFTFVFFGTGTVVQCNDYWLTGEVHVNSGLEITETITNASINNETNGVTEDCSSPLGPLKFAIPGLVGQGGTEHWCLKSLSKDKFELRGHGCTETAGTLTVVFDFTGSMTCKYEDAGSITGSFTTNTTPATVKPEGEFEFKGEAGNPFGCPVSWKITQMAVRLFTDTETEAQSTEDPLTIS